MTTSPWVHSWPSPEASELARSAISDWPPDIETIVLSTGYELYVVDHSGIRWSQEMQERPGSSADTAAGSATVVRSATPFDGVAVSNNRQFVAYVDHATEIVVRSLGDGAEISRVTYHAEGETQLRCLSSDGESVALASVPPHLPKGTTGARLPWRVTIVDMLSGEATIERPLEDLVKERTAGDPQIQFTLYLLDWLPGHRLLVSYTGRETYSYDPATKVIEEIPGMSYVWTVSDTGTVCGWGRGADGPQKDVETQVWDARIWDAHVRGGLTTQVLALDDSSGYALGGAFNLRGDALAVGVTSPQHEPQGWQVFRLNQGRWERSGPLTENSWLTAAPVALSSDGTLAYAALEGGLEWESGQSAALLSYDFQKGVWQEWLGPKDMQASLHQYPFVALIPEQ